MILRKYTTLFAVLALLAPSLALASNGSSNSTRVQGTPDGYGDPVQVTIVDNDGDDASISIGTITAGDNNIGNVDVASSALPTGAATSALQTTISGQLPSARGQQTTANSISVSFASDYVASSAISSDDEFNANVGIGTKSFTYVCDGSGTQCWDRQRGDTNGTVVQPALATTYWRYAAASGGIDNSNTAVTLKAASGASTCAMVNSITLSHDALGAATEIAIRDGAAGTVMWRGKLQTTALEDDEIVFVPPLKGTANTLVEFLTITAVTGDVFVNASGFTIAC